MIRPPYPGPAPVKEDELTTCRLYKRYDDLIAAARPAQLCYGTLHFIFEFALDDGRVIDGRNGALQIFPQSVGREELRFCHRFGSDPTLRGERIANVNNATADFGSAPNQMTNCFCANVPGGRLTDAIVRLELHSSFWQTS